VSVYFPAVLDGRISKAECRTRPKREWGRATEAVVYSVTARALRAIKRQEAEVRNEDTPLPQDPPVPPGVGRSTGRSSSEKEEGPVITYPYTEVGVTDAFIALGLDPDDVAEVLTEEGIRGIPGSDCNCPIAHYLEQSIVGCASVGVFLDDALGREREAHARLEALEHLALAADDDGVLHVDLTAAVIVFIRRFDAGKYPELIEENSHAAA